MKRKVARRARSTLRKQSRRAGRWHARHRVRNVAGRIMAFTHNRDIFSPADPKFDFGQFYELMKGKDTLFTQVS